MEQQFNKPSIKISGSGSAGGGDYDQIKISGSGKLTGDASCHTFKVSGSTAIEGSLKAVDAGMSGSTRFRKNVEAETFKASGSVKVDGDIKAQELKTSGSFTVGGALSGEFLSFSGAIKVAADCNAEQFNLNGQCQIGGLLNADSVTIELEGRSEVKAIGAANIRITEGRYGGFIKDLVGLFSDQSGKLICETIEGDEIYLENTICEMVRGGQITIGKGCQIKQVEYSGSLKVESDGRVDTQVQL